MGSRNALRTRGPATNGAGLSPRIVPPAPAPRQEAAA